jgi:hypothetical protein
VSEYESDDLDGMPGMNSKDASREVLWSGGFLDVVRINRWEFVRRKNITGIVGIVPVTDDGISSADGRQGH